MEQIIRKFRKSNEELFTEEEIKLWMGKLSSNIDLDTLYIILSQANQYSVSEIVEGLVSGEEYITSPTMIKYHHQYNERLNSYLAELEKSKSVHRCPKCHGNENVSYYEKQVRSADQPMSIFLECNDCVIKWRIG